MEEKVKIIFSAEQRSDGENAEISQILDGTRRDEGDTVILTFDEAWEGVEEAVHSVMRIQENSVTVERKGPVRTVMEFLAESDTMCEYETALGTLDFVITTLDMEIERSAERIQVMVHYEMYAQGSLISENRLSVEGERKICQ